MKEALMTPDLTIRAVHPQDRANWGQLYAGYAAFYQVEQTEPMRDMVWSWLHDPAHESQGLVAQNRSGQLLGLAHFRAFARPLSASTGGFLDDLFVTPEARGGKVGVALIAALRTHAKAQGWSVLRWITAENNYRARALYDTVATRTAWVTYDLKP